MQTRLNLAPERDVVFTTSDGEQICSVLWTGPSSLSPKAVHHTNVLERYSGTRGQFRLLLAGCVDMGGTEGGLLLNVHLQRGVGF